ncbi:hypothetical protein, partial [Nocardioides sp. P5_C9_2]
VRPRGWRSRPSRAAGVAAVEATMRRLRATVMDLEPTPAIIAVALPGDAGPETAVSEALAESFAKAGHRVVLVRADAHTVGHGLEVEERGLAEALLHERLNVLEMLQPSVEPLLCLLPWGSTAESRELLAPERLRKVLMPLVDDGHLVVLQSPGIDTPEGEALVGAADLGLVVVTARRTPTRLVRETAARAQAGRTRLAALVVGSRMPSSRGHRATSDRRTGTEDVESKTREAVVRAPR